MTIDPEKLTPGKWILVEKLTYGRFSHPMKIINVSGSRVYWRKPRYRLNGTTVDEWEMGYSAIKSVRHVVATRELGVAAFDEQMRLSKILDQEQRAALARFNAGMESFFKANLVQAVQPVMAHDPAERWCGACQQQVTRCAGDAQGCPLRFPPNSP